VKPVTLLWLGLALEVPLFAAGALWMGLQGLDWSAALRPTLDGTALGVGLGVLGAGLSVGMLVLGPALPGLRAYRQWVEAVLVPIFGSLGPMEAAVLAASAGLGEETFFRGALQPAIGLVPTAVIFGLAHVGLPRRELLPMLLYAFGFGLALGLLRTWLPLWPLVVAHAVLDLIDLSYIRLKLAPSTRLR